MDTLIKFRQKQFGGKSKEAIKFVKTPAGIISVTALGVSSANLATNMSRHKHDQSYQEKQIEAMNKLTRSINGLDKTVKNESGETKKSSITFKPKFLK
jgi:hypothetical protein